MNASKRVALSILLCAAAISALETTCPYFTSADPSIPLIISHRGASGYLPEHTLAGYSEAFYMGADFIEQDVVATKDGELVCVHDMYLSDVTDVASHPEFADRKRNLILNNDEDGRDDWWAQDFTLEEIKTLRIHQRYGGRNHFYDGMFQIPTLKETLDLLVSLNAKRLAADPTSRLAGAYIELKYPDFLKAIGFDTNQMVYDMLVSYGLGTCAEANAKLPVIIQDFFESTLDFFHEKSDLPLIYLGGVLSLEYTATKAHGVGPSIDKLLTTDDPFTPNDYAANAHKLGLKVHPFTLREDHSGYGNTPCEKNMNMLKLNIDGLFTEFPDAAQFFWASSGCHTARRELTFLADY